MADEKGLISIEEIKTLIKELGGYKKVADEIGVKEGSLKSTLSRGTIGEQTIKSILLLKKYREAKKELEFVDKIRDFFIKK